MNEHKLSTYLVTYCIGGSRGRRRRASPQQDQFLSFLHMFSLKVYALEVGTLPNGSAPPPPPTPLYCTKFTFGKIIHLKITSKYNCYMTNTTSDVSRMSIIFTKFTYLPLDVSETHTSLRSTELSVNFAL